MNNNLLSLCGYLSISWCWLTLSTYGQPPEAASSDGTVQWKSCIEYFGWLKSIPISVLYSTKLEQFPSYQEIVLKNNPSAVARIQEKGNERDTIWQFIRLLSEGEKHAMHRIREVDRDGVRRVGLNLFSLDNGVTARDILFNSGGEFESLATLRTQASRLKMDIKKKSVERDSVAFDRPVDSVIDYLGAYCGSIVNGGLIPTLKKVQFKSNNVTECSIVGEVGAMTVIVSLNRENGAWLPVSIASTSSDPDVKTDVQFTYKQVALPEARKQSGTLSKDFIYPVNITETKQVLFNGKYVTYLRRILDVSAVDVASFAFKGEEAITAFPILTPSEIAQLAPH